MLQNSLPQDGWMDVTQYEGHPDQKLGHISYAQSGDDYMILNIFKLLEIDKPSYLDLGAHHPFIISNTALLYKNGSRGVNVEANPSLIGEFFKHRPEDKNINVGVAPMTGMAEFYVFGEFCGRNTFSKAEAEDNATKHDMHVQDTLRLPMMSLNGIVNTHCGGVFPDFLTCDLEGMDYDVLSTLTDYAEAGPSNKPKVICVETRQGPPAKKMRAMLFTKGYLPYCRMGENLFFIMQDYIFALE